MQQVALLGAGGHSKVVWDILQCLRERDSPEVVAVLDDNSDLWGRSFQGLTIDGPIEKMADLPIDTTVVAIGDNRARRQVYERVRGSGVSLLNAIHPSAVIARDVQVGHGIVACANAVVNIGTVIGDNVILNTACSVDHDCVIGPYVHIAPGVHLSGMVSVGGGTLVGVGAIAIPGVHIGENAVVGGAAAVIGDLPDGVTAVGVPARIIKSRKQ